MKTYRRIANYTTREILKTIKRVVGCEMNSKELEYAHVSMTSAEFLSEFDIFYIETRDGKIVLYFERDVVVKK